MKKLILLGLAIVLFNACQNSDVRFTTTSAEIEEVKALVNDYHNGDWDAWKSHYADTAKIYHNNWKTAATPDETRESLKGILSNTSSYHFEEDPIFYEQIVDDDGDTWVNFWGNWKGTLKANGKVLEIPVQLSLLMIDGKIAEEYGFYNVSEFTTELQAIEAANNRPVEEQKINNNMDSFVGTFLNKQDASVLNDILTKDYVRYLNGVKVCSSADELEPNLKVFFDGFPDFHITLTKKFIDGNTGFVNWTMTGTNSAEFNGMAATGKEVSISGLSRLEFNNQGLLQSEDVYFNELDLMKQLGHSLTK